MSRTERIIFIDRQISSRGLVKRKQVAKEFECHIDTIKRDIVYMRDYLQAPIKWSNEKQGYVYTHPFDLLDYAKEESVLFHVFLRSMMNNLGSSGLHYLPLVSSDILKRSEELIPSEYWSLTKSIQYHAAQLEHLPMKTFSQVLTAIKDEVSAEIRYVNAQGRYSERKIDPRLVINYSGNWYIVAYCHERRELTTFLFSRIEQITLTELPIKPGISREEVEKYAQSASGMYKSSNPRWITVRFHEPAYWKVNHQLWHKDQKTETGEIKGKKYIDFTVPVGWSAEEIYARVFAYAPHGEVIGPKEFRDEWVGKVRELGERV